MFSFNKPFDAITADDIQNLVIDQTPENRTLDYKEDLPVPGRDGRNDFLADISALANTDGGWLIYGIEEERQDSKNTGLPKQAHGIPSISPDEAKRRLESWLQDGLDPRLEGVRIATIPGFDKGPVMLVHVPKSWNAPHMIAVGSPKFYTRSDGGNTPLICAQVRSAFLRSEALSERIRRFHAERLGKIMGDEMPLALDSKHRVILHLIPLSSMAPGATADLELAQKDTTGNLFPLSGSGYESKRYNFDGFVTCDYKHSYMQFFRTGIIESVDASVLSVNGVIPTTVFEPHIFDAVKRYLAIFKQISIPPPVVLLLTLVGVKGYSTQTETEARMGGFSFPRPIDRDILTLPDLLIEDLSAPADVALRPAFDMIWQACGYKSCPNYDVKTGTWKALRAY